MKICATRYKPEPRSGKSKGLELVLDAHNDIIDASTIPNDFEVPFSLGFHKSYYQTYRKTVHIS